MVGECLGVVLLFGVENGVKKMVFRKKWCLGVVARDRRMIIIIKYYETYPPTNDL